MTDNLPALVDPTDALPAVHRADTDSWINVVGEVAKFAGYIAGTEFVPKSLRDSPAAATAAIMYGREVGLPPMTALTQTHVIEGRPSMSAEAMRALILAAGHEIEVSESTGGICKMRGKRRGSERWSTEVVWTIDAARQAGLTNKSNWKSYPRQMLQARCTAELARLVFPDVIHGFRAVEELDDEGMEETAAPALPGSSTVRRASKKAAAKKTTPAPLEPRGERPALTGPPLPGEEGYEPTTNESPGAAPDAPSLSEGREGEEQHKGGTEPASSPDVGGPAEPAADTRDDATENPGGEAGGEATAEPPGGTRDRGPRKSTRAQHRLIFALLDPLDVKSDEDRYDVATAIVGHRIESFNDLTHDNASTMVDTLGRVKTREDLDALLAAAAGGDS